MEKRKLAVLGHFGGPKQFNDGQTVKSIVLYNALQEKIGSVDKIDTYYIKHNPVRFACDTIKMVFRDKQIIVIVSSNGRKLLFPILYFLSKYLHKEVYHSGIGGRLARETKNNRRLKKYVTQFNGNWMESSLLVKNLHKLGINNAVYVPNFKHLDILTAEDLDYDHKAPFKFCIFSRIMPEKGVEDAINAIDKINLKYGYKIAILDLYGPIEQGYEDHLNKILGGTQYSKYYGVIDANKSVEVLKHYYCLLFPTHWMHEGIPGTIIDALSAGIPVISRKWQYCTEMIDNNVTGLIYDFEKPEELSEMIEKAINHPIEMLEMKTKCLEKSKEYSEDIVIKQILQLLNR